MNLTTTTPNEARELATWAAAHGVDYLDGAIMAVPADDRQPGGGDPVQRLGGGVRRAPGRARRRGARARYVGEDSGLASLFDLAMLAGMYTMFAGFLHGAAMVGSVGVSAPPSSRPAPHRSSAR